MTAALTSGRTSCRLGDLRHFSTLITFITLLPSLPQNFHADKLAIDSNSTPRSPAIAGGSLSKMPTFQGDERGRGSPRAVRSGKRNLREDDSDSADGRVKSRRATPIRHDGPVARSSGLGYGTRSFLNEPSDMIDLTGYALRTPFTNETHGKLVKKIF